MTKDQIADELTQALTLLLRVRTHILRETAPDGLRAADPEEPGNRARITDPICDSRNSDEPEP